MANGLCGQSVTRALPNSAIFFNDIVVIEHDDILRRRLSSLLDGYCKNLFTFESLEPALLHLQERTPPAVVVTDLYFPEGRFLALIRSCVRRSEVIVISDLVSQEEAFMLGKMGVKSYLNKPVDAERLNAALHSSFAFASADGNVAESNTAKRTATKSTAAENKFTIKTFGGLSILKNGCEIAFSRKTPYRILEFIVCILSLGAKDVPVSKVCDRLWPDADGDKAENCFTACLRRARDLLDSKDADVLIRKAGKISFNPDKVVVDIWCMKNAGNALFETYGSAHFCRDWLPEYDLPWLMQPREDYRNMSKALLKPHCFDVMSDLG